jgi:hypothetical protein
MPSLVTATPDPPSATFPSSSLAAAGAASDATARGERNARRRHRRRARRGGRAQPATCRAIIVGAARCAGSPWIPLGFLARGRAVLLWWWRVVAGRRGICLARRWGSVAGVDSWSRRWPLACAAARGSFVPVWLGRMPTHASMGIFGSKMRKIAVRPQRPFLSGRCQDYKFVNTQSSFIRYTSMCYSTPIAKLSIILYNSVTGELLLINYLVN